jgi:hypothetical protein
LGSSASSHLSFLVPAHRTAAEAERVLLSHEELSHDELSHDELDHDALSQLDESQDELDPVVALV